MRTSLVQLFSVCGLPAQRLYSGANGNLFPENLSCALCLPRLLLPEPPSLKAGHHTSRRAAALTPCVSQRPTAPRAILAGGSAPCLSSLAAWITGRTPQSVFPVSCSLASCSPCLLLPLPLCPDCFAGAWVLPLSLPERPSPSG